MPNRRGVRGQSLVETVLVLPLMVLLVLGILQLTSMQQAKLLTTYAAFQAARAGIVWNGNNERMRDAAIGSLLPSAGQTHSPEAMAKTYRRFMAQDAEFESFWESPEGPSDVNGSTLRGVVRVDTLSPAPFTALDDVWKLRRGPGGWEELDADDVTGFIDHPELETRFRRFKDLSLEDADEASLRRATLLTVRIRYLYELKIPLANAFIFTAWSALKALSLGESKDESGLASILPTELQTLRRVARQRSRFFIPLSATYSLRMQSSFHRKWAVQDLPVWEP